MSYRRTEFDTEQTILLGGQTSEKHNDLKMIAVLGTYGDIYTLIKHWPDIMKIKDKRERILKLIEYLGLYDFMESCNEITKLSAALGDTRKRYSMKGVLDGAKRLHNQPDTGTPTGNP